MAYITGKIPNGCCSVGEFTDGVYHVAPEPDDRFVRTGKTNLWSYFFAEIIGKVGERITIHLHWPQYDRLCNQGFNHGVPGDGFVKNAAPFGPIVPELLYYSADGVHWRRIEDAVQDYGAAAFTITLESPRSYLSVGYPYTRQMADKLSRDMAELPWVRREVLGLDGGMEEVVMYTCTDFSVPVSRKKSIWLQGVQHCIETHGACMADAMLRFLAGPEGTALRKKYIFHFVPVVSVWNWLQGRGEHMSDRNPNRDWQKMTLPEVRTICRTFESLIEQGERFALTFDVHTGASMDPPSIDRCVSAIWVEGEEDDAGEDSFTAYALKYCDFPPTAPGHDVEPGSFSAFTCGFGVKSYVLEISRTGSYDRESGKGRRYSDEVMEKLGKDFVSAIDAYLSRDQAQP